MAFVVGGMKEVVHRVISDFLLAEASKFGSTRRILSVETGRSFEGNQL